MKQIFFLYLLFVLSLPNLLLVSCGLFDADSNLDWQNLKFPEQSVYVLFLDGNDVYAGAGYDGLWGLDMSNSNAEWEYLGHRVTEGERHFDAGVQAVDVFKDKITIGYADPPEQEDGQRQGYGVARIEGNPGSHVMMAQDS